MDKNEFLVEFEWSFKMILVRLKGDGAIWERSRPPPKKISAYHSRKNKMSLPKEFILLKLLIPTVYDILYILLRVWNLCDPSEI